MHKPTATQFFTVYAVFWLSGIVGIVVFGGLEGAALPIAISIWNMMLVCINLIGACASMALGWSPWRETK